MEDLSVWWPLVWTLLVGVGAVLWFRVTAAGTVLFAEFVLVIAFMLWLAMSLTGWLVWALLTPPVITF